MNMKIHPTSPDQRGFTLIEIMIVISIVAVVTSFAIPALEDSRRQANEAAAISMLKATFSAQQRFKNLKLPPSHPTSGWAYTYEDLAQHDQLPPLLEQRSINTYSYSGYEYYTFGGALDHSIDELRQLLIFARPTHSSAGNRSFLMTEAGRIYYRSDGVFFYLAQMGSPLGEGGTAPVQPSKRTVSNGDV
jgi:prepilin-type N-terminal cleavage/methylation domain-containing protein